MFIGLSLSILKLIEPHVVQEIVALVNSSSTLTLLTRLLERALLNLYFLARGTSRDVGSGFSVLGCVVRVHVRTVTGSTRAAFTGVHALVILTH